LRVGFGNRRPTGEKTQTSKEEIPEKEDAPKEAVDTRWLPQLQAKPRGQENRGLQQSFVRDAVQPTCSGRRVCLSFGRSGNARTAVIEAR